MYPRGRAGVSFIDAGPGFAPVTEPVIGNQLPGWTGSSGNRLDTTNVKDTPGPGPHNYPPVGGRVGHYDGSSGPDPGSPGGLLPANPRRVAPVVEGQASNGASGPPLGYAQGAGRAYGVDGWGWAARLNAPNREDPLPHGRESFRRFGVIGFNDRLQVRDRHAYFDRGHTRNPSTADRTMQQGGLNPQLDGPARPDLRTVNISVNPQLGSDNTRNQDDRSRNYSPYGQQDGTVQPIYGGVPGLFIPYGTRGGVPYPIHDPTNGDGGPEAIWPGPPHGLHSDTLPAGKQIADRYRVVPQMRPVRIDRPDNTRIAGQSFSQTVQMQGDTGQKQGPRSHEGAGLGLSFHLGSGWRGRNA